MLVIVYVVGSCFHGFEEGSMDWLILAFVSKEMAETERLTIVISIQFP